MQLSCSFPAVPLQARCRALKIPCRQGLRRLAVPLQFPCGFPLGPPLQLSGSVPAVPLQASCRAVKIPCRQGPRRLLAVPLQFPCRALQISCRALAFLLQSSFRFPAIPSHISRRFPTSPLAVSLQFPCRFPAILLQSPCGSLADSLQVQPGSFLAVGLQRSSRPPAVVSPRATFIPPQPLAVHPAMKCIACFAAAGRPFCITLEP